MAGFNKDLGLVNYDYNAVLSIFFVAYIIFEIPSNVNYGFGPVEASLTVSRLHASGLVLDGSCQQLLLGSAFAPWLRLL